MKKRMIALLLALIMVMTTLTGCVKIIKTGTEGEYTGKKTFSADENVESFWDSKAIPELTANASDLKTLLEEANGNLKSVQDKYKGSSLDKGASLTYTVKGTGKVTQVNTQSKAGTMKIELEGYSGSVDIEIQIGTVIKGSSVRDSLSFVKYGDYTNQTEYAQVNQSVNKKILATVISPEKANEYLDKTITFIGCFAPGNDNAKILITPVVITVS